MRPIATTIIHKHSLTRSCCIISVPTTNACTTCCLCIWTVDTEWAVTALEGFLQHHRSVSISVLCRGLTEKRWIQFLRLSYDAKGSSLYLPIELSIRYRIQEQGETHHRSRNPLRLLSNVFWVVCHRLSYIWILRYFWIHKFHKLFLIPKCYQFCRNYCSNMWDDCRKCRSVTCGVRR